MNIKIIIIASGLWVARILTSNYISELIHRPDLSSPLAFTRLNAINDVLLIMAIIATTVVFISWIIHFNRRDLTAN
jgi:hypothetical protein